jgi:hypothetical protein
MDIQIFSILLSFIAFGVGYYYGYIKGKMFVIQQTNYYYSYADDPNAIEFYIEKVSEELLLYEKLTNNFIVKFTTLEETKEFLQNKYPGKIVWIKKENLQSVGLDLS